MFMTLKVVFWVCRLKDFCRLAVMKMCLKTMRGRRLALNKECEIKY